MRKAIVTVALLLCVSAALTAQVRARGVGSAPILIEVFSDFQCPGCKELYEKTLLPLTWDYVDKGKVYLVHREYPLPIHAHAMEAAFYACAANRVGKYEQASEVLFRKQTTWAADGKVDETVCSVLSLAEAKKVRALAKDPRVIAEVQQDIQTGRDNKVDGTPMLILTHHLRQYRIPGGVSYPILRRFIDQLLEKN